VCVCVCERERERERERDLLIGGGTLYASVLAYLLTLYILLRRTIFYYVVLADALCYIISFLALYITCI
jgi:hypothetical protein